MLLTILKQSFTNQKKAMALMVISVAVGTAVSAALIALSFDIKGKVAAELRSFGANITIEPKVEGLADLAGQERFLRDEDIIKAKTIFWRHNILGIVPFLESTATLRTAAGPRTVKLVGTWFNRPLAIPGEREPFRAGIYTVSPWWEVQGREPGQGEVLLGATMATELGLQPGALIELDGKGYMVSGLLATGAREDSAIVMDLSVAQVHAGRPGAVSRVMVSALTTPMDDFAYRDPEAMSTAEYEKWYCTGYVTSIAKQLEEVFKGSRARPIWQVAETEGRVLGRLSVLIYLLTAAALMASALGMSTTMAASLLRRTDEVGLMKALGADSYNISMIFLAEAMVIGLVGGVAGYLASLGVSRYISMQVFASEMTNRELLLPIAVLSALGIAAVGSMLPIRRALRIKSAIVLKEAH